MTEEERRARRALIGPIPNTTGGQAEIGLYPRGKQWEVDRPSWWQSLTPEQLQDWRLRRARGEKES